MTHKLQTHGLGVGTYWSRRLPLVCSEAVETNAAADPPPVVHVVWGVGGMTQERPLVSTPHHQSCSNILEKHQDHKF